MCDLVRLAAAGVAVLFAREFPAGDKLSRHIGSTVQRPMQDALTWWAGASDLGA